MTKGFVPTTSGGPIRAVLLECRRVGVDEREVLAAGKLQPTDLDDPDRRFPATATLQVWEAALRATADEVFGLHAAENMPWGGFGVPDFIAANASTLRGGLERLSRYFAIITEGGQLRFEENDDEALMLYDNLGVTGPVIRHAAEFTLGCVTLRFRHRSGEAIALREVWFRHDPPADTNVHRRVFEAPICFGRGLDAIVFDRKTLDGKLQGENPHLAAIVEKVGDEQLARLPGAEAALSDRVRQKLRGGFASGTDLAVSEVARGLGVSSRTLQRRLRNEGSSFQQLREATRHELACRWLERPDLSIAEVAFLLDFSEPSAFHRAFKRWTGQTPAAYRTLDRPFCLPERHFR